MMDSSNHKLIDLWFPCAAVDEAVRKPAGSGKVEKAIFPWFASRPIAQARAAVLTALLSDSAEVRHLVERAVRHGDHEAIAALSAHVQAQYPSGRPVVLDLFSGRGIIPLEAARVGATAIGTDLSPVATLAGRMLGDYPLRDWSKEPTIPFGSSQETPSDDEEEDEQGELDVDTTSSEPRYVSDSRSVLAEIGRRVRRSVAVFYPAGTEGLVPWGYQWAVTITCDGCSRRFPLVGSLSLRHPYIRTSDPGQTLRIVTEGDQWRAEVIQGTPDQLPTFRAASGRKGKSAHCPFCRHVHSLDAVKSKGFAQGYGDVPLAAGFTVGKTKKVFRALSQHEVEAALNANASAYPAFGSYTAVPDEEIPPGNEDTIRASGYGYRTYGSLMCARQTLQFVETVRHLRDVHQELLRAGLSTEYAVALTACAAATLVRRLKRATRGARLEVFGKVDGTGQNRSAVSHVFAEESKLTFNFDYFESGPGLGPGTWASISEGGLKALAKHTAAVRGRSARLRRASALAVPFRDGSVDAVVTDPPYYNMIDYADASDLFYVWLKRALFDILPDLFADRGLQDKAEEVIVKRGGAADEHRTKDFYEASLAKSFAEARRVLRADGHLVVVFGHSDPDAWRRLLGALHHAGFVVTSSWPSRTESANTGVASIKVTVTIGCRVALAVRSVATANQVDGEVADLVHVRAKDWVRDGLALPDQMMAAYGPAMEVYGRYSAVIMPDGAPAALEHYLTLARRAVRDAMALKLDQIPLETFDPITAFAVFWMRAFGRTVVPKGEAKFTAQSSSLRIEDVRALVLTEAGGGYKLELGGPFEVDSTTPVFNVVRAMAESWQREGSDGVASVFVKAERTADDQHVWAVVGDLATQLPVSDTISKALAAIQRNRTTIQSLARGISQRRASDENQLQLTDV